MSLEDYLRKFANLNTAVGRKIYPAATMHRAPHKPLLLLSAMDLIAQEVINKNFIEPSSELVETFNTYISLVLPIGWKTSMAYPFPRLQREGFWHRITNAGYDPAIDYNVTTIAQLRKIYVGANLDDDLFVYMLNPETRLRLRTQLIDSYFAPELRLILLDQGDVNLEAYKYSRMLISGLTDRAPERPLEKAQKIRYQGFRKAIVQLYEHRCALCGIRMLTPEGHTVVEAAHIKPWYESHDDKPTNGLCLCRLCHWSFDEGLMSISKKYEVMVSKRVQFDINKPGHMTTIADRPIFRPKDEGYWPGLKNIAWHQKNAFN